MFPDAVTDDNAEETAPLTHSQRNLWFIRQLVPDSPVYNMSRAWHVNGDLDVAALRQAVALLVGRHESLRARIRLAAGEPVQWAPAESPDVLEYADMRRQPEAGDDEAIGAIVAAECRKVIDLENGPVFRVRLLHVADGRFVLLMVMHHAFSDGWSLAVLARDLGGFYNALVSGREPDLPILKTSYFEYARTLMSAPGSTTRPDLDYWRQVLADAPPLLDLPTDFARPAMQRFRGRRLLFEVGADTVAGLESLARDHRATLFMVLLSAFNILLYRFSGKSDICVGTPFGNRNASALEDLAGMFVNTLVIRNRIDEAATFGELLGSVRGRLLGAFQHASTPLEQIIEHIGVPRDPGYNPLFQVMFVLQNTPKCTLELDSLATRDFGAELFGQAGGIGVAKLDLSLAITVRNGTLRCALEYNTDLFLEETANSLGRSFVQLLGALCAQPDRPIDRLPLLGHAERQRILFEWNRTDAIPCPDGTVPQSFSRQVAQTPDAVALIDAAGETSYRELDLWAKRIAGLLRDRGLRPGDVVAIVAAPSADWIAAMLGVLRSGCIALPLEPAFPAPRLRSFVEHGGARVIMVPRKVHARSGELGAPVLAIPGMRETIRETAADGPPAAGDPDAAYIMFTSGSTGSPRAVAGTHRGILNRCEWMAREYPYGDAESCCQHISPAFVDVFAEVFGPLLAGAALSVIGREARSDPALLIAELERLGVARITLTPTMLKSMLDTRSGVRGLKRLALWISSGEPLDRELCRRFSIQLPDARLLNVYGSTEVAADATCFDCAQIPDAGRVPVGRPIANVRTYILDQHMAPLPPGFVGELHVGGAGVAQGYWRRRTATADGFVSDPFETGPDRIYKTGDLARYREDGNIEVLGRADGQVKLHGVRIGVEEVEARLELHEDVRKALVGLWTNANGQEFLTAWCVPEPGCVPSSRELRRFLGHWLPRQWVPSHYVPVDALPLLASGKVDRRALPAPGIDTTCGVSGAREPEGDVERELYSIWAELLRCEVGDSNADFFDLGGNSLLVFQLLDRIESAFGVRLQVGAVFLAPTIAELAARIRQLSTADQIRVIIKIRDRDGPPLVCVPAAATTVLSLSGLGSRFEHGQSMYGIEYYGLISGTDPHDNIGEMAQICVDALRREQPHGPYCVAGRCFGGVVAIEMARRLSEAGECVALLALLETGVPLRNIDRVLAALEPAGRKQLETLYAADRVRFARTRADIEAEFERGLVDAPARIQKMMRTVYGAHQEALRTYAPAPVDVPITVFRSRAGRWHERVGWDLFTRSGYRCLEFDGDRDSMFEAPHVHELSRALSAEMKRALGAGIA